jgi:hypothetical protein
MSQNIYELMQSKTEKESMEQTVTLSELQTAELTIEYKLERYSVFVCQKHYYFAIARDCQTSRRDGQPCEREFEVECYGRLAGAEDLHINWPEDQCYWKGDLKDQIDALNWLCDKIEEVKGDH